MSTGHDLFFQIYAAFNARDIDTVLAVLAPDVEWPNGMEGGYVHGHQAVRDYWTRQFTLIDPHVDPIRFDIEEDGRTAVTVHQVVRDLAGQVIADSIVEHVYRIENGVIRHMEIRTR